MIHRKCGEQKHTADDVIKVKKNNAERLRGVLKRGGIRTDTGIFLQSEMYDFIWMLFVTVHIHNQSH